MCISGISIQKFKKLQILRHNIFKMKILPNSRDVVVCFKSIDGSSREECQMLHVNRKDSDYSNF